MILTENPPGCLFQDDEDKGSPSRDGVNCFGGFHTAIACSNHQNEKIDRSAEALRVRHHPFYLSLRT